MNKWGLSGEEGARVKNKIHAPPACECQNNPPITASHLFAFSGAHSLPPYLFFVPGPRTLFVCACLPNSPFRSFSISPPFLFFNNTQSGFVLAMAGSYSSSMRIYALHLSSILSLSQLILRMTVRLRNKFVVSSDCHWRWISTRISYSVFDPTNLGGCPLSAER